MNEPTLDRIAAALFAAAIVHTFLAPFFTRLASCRPRYARLLHLLGEVEIVFGLWAVVLLGAVALMAGGDAAVAYAASRSYTEPLFVFVIMVVAASRPVRATAESLVLGLAQQLPMRTVVAEVWLSLAAVPLAGSLVTEPAAMTLAALLLGPLVFRTDVPERLKYTALGVLFVNVSIGGTLTAFAAPPVLMVADTWHWNTAFMLRTFGWRSALAVAVNASMVTWLLRPHLIDVVAKPIGERPGTSFVPTAALLRSEPASSAASAASAASESTPSTARTGTAVSPEPSKPPVPMHVRAIHLGFLLVVVWLAHRPLFLVATFVLFVSYAHASARHQEPLLWKPALRVAFFLGGLVVIGGLQHWWLGPLVSSLDGVALFAAAVGFTAITDNAAVTYLGSLVDGLDAHARYLLVAGAVAGGGLTVIANAPNPAGVALLKHGFAGEAIGAGRLLLGAAAPTAVAIAMVMLMKWA